MVSRSIYNLKIDTIYMYNIPVDRSFLQLSNGIRHVMPSTNTKSELTAKASMAHPVSQPAVYANGLKTSSQIENEMGGTCSRYGRERRCVEVCGGENRGKEATWKTQA
jgi:hypothetical protein